MRLRISNRKAGDTHSNETYLESRLSKLNKIQKVTGYKVRIHNGLVSPRIMITDIDGNKIRLNGFLWGYSGQGPRATMDLLKTCGYVGAEDFIKSQPDDYYTMPPNRKYQKVWEINL